jgi:hypothetical protein
MLVATIATYPQALNEEAISMADIDFDPGIDAYADLGTAVFLLDACGDHETADLLEIASLTYDLWNGNFGQRQYQAKLAVEIALLYLYTEDVCARIETALNDVLRASTDSVVSVIPYPKKVQGDWRALRREGRLTGITNQATLMPLKPNHPRKYGLNFRDAAEVRVFEAFERLQASLPPEDTILVAPNPVAFVAGKAREVDCLVTYRGRAGVVEVDGDTHRNRYAADQSRDRFLRDAGINLVERIVAEDTNDPTALDLFVRRFLNRLIAR